MSAVEEYVGSQTTLMSSGEILRMSFTLADLGGVAAWAEAITDAINRCAKPVTAVISSTDPGLRELEVRMVADFDGVGTQTPSNEGLHVALQLDASQLDRYDQLGWSCPSSDPTRYSTTHRGGDAVKAGVVQMLDTMTTALGFDEHDELELRVSF